MYKKAVYLIEEFKNVPFLKLYAILKYSIKTLLLIIIGLEVINFISALYNLKSFQIILIQILLIFIVAINLLKRVLIAMLLKKSNYFKKKYRKNSFLRKTTKELFNLVSSFFLQKFLFLYKEYPLCLFVILIVYSYFVKNVLLLAIFWCHFIYDAILDLPLLKDFKKKRAGDILSFNFHWNFDYDLVILKRFLMFFYLLGFSIIYFSYFIFISVLGPLANEYTFLFINLTISLRDIQYYLAINLVGPIILVICIFIKILLNLHVIYFRNPSTVLRGFATFATTISVVGVGTALVGLASAGFGLGSVYHSGGVSVDNMAKNTVDRLKDGVVRHTVQQDQAFILCKKAGIDMVPKNIVENDSTKILDMHKLHEELSLKKNETFLEKIPAPELQAMGFTDLISEIKLLRHNLLVYTNIGNGFSKDDYIVRFNLLDKQERLMHGVDSPSKDEVHEHYKKVAASLCKTPAHIEEYNDFLSGKSNKLFYSLRYQQEYGLLTSKKDIVSSVFVGTPRVDSESELERIARNIPRSLADAQRLKNLKTSELSTENVGEAIRQQINRPMPPLIKNEPENP